MLQLSVNMRDVRYITAKCKHDRGPVYYSLSVNMREVLLQLSVNMRGVW